MFATMSVFISWSGERSRLVALGLRRFLGVVLQQSTPWMSEKDIAGGDVADAEIETHLRKATFGVLCVTPENLLSPWLNYEAGAIGHQVNERRRVCPLLLELLPNDVSRPIGRFQS